MTLLATTITPEMAVNTHTKPTIAGPGTIVMWLSLFWQVVDSMSDGDEQALVSSRELGGTTSYLSQVRVQ